MTTYSQSDLATRVLRDLGLIGAEEVPSATDLDLREIDRKIEATAISLAAFKLHVAELHPTAVELSQIEARLSASLDRLSSRIDRLLERDGR
jgi:hypothetical protein